MMAGGLPAAILLRRLSLVCLWFTWHASLRPFILPPIVDMNLPHLLQKRRPLIQYNLPWWVMCVVLPWMVMVGCWSFQGLSPPGHVPHNLIILGHSCPSMSVWGMCLAQLWPQWVHFQYLPCIIRWWPLFSSVFLVACVMPMWVWVCSCGVIMRFVWAFTMAIILSLMSHACVSISLIWVLS